MLIGDELRRPLQKGRRSRIFDMKRNKATERQLVIDALEKRIRERFQQHPNKVVVVSAGLMNTSSPKYKTIFVKPGTKPQYFLCDGCSWEKKNFQKYSRAKAFQIFANSRIQAVEDHIANLKAEANERKNLTAEELTVIQYLESGGW